MDYDLRLHKSKVAGQARSAGSYSAAVVVGLGLGLILALAPGAIAETAVEGQSPVTPNYAPPSSGPEDTQAAKLMGFRSALFGSDEKSVRAAIVKDFGVTDKAISKSQNLADRTDVLTVKVPDVLPGGGTADVAYVFGYKSKALTQVSVIWSKGTDKSLTAERLVADGETLKTYFAGAGYDPKTVAGNSAVRDGILLFRGADAAGHTTALMLHGTMAPGQDKTTQTFVPNALFLFYLADPKAPDVFKITAGRF